MGQRSSSARRTGRIDLSLCKCVVFSSVREPIFIYDPPNILYLEDGDVACYDEGTGEIVKVLDGNPFHVYNLDALSITEDPDSAPE